MSTAYEIVWFRGHRFDRMTVQALLAMEKRLGYELTVLQGSYNGTAVGASAGTHAGGGAVDLAPAHAADKVRVGREVGFAMWERLPIPGLWPHHVHGILVGNLKVSPSAGRQIIQYRNHTDGLVSMRRDTFWHPTPIKPYVYKVEPTIAVDLSELRIDFLNALEGQARNLPHRRVRIVQRRLNAKVGGTKLLVDGVVGEKTLDKWGVFEKRSGHGEGRPRIPDAPTLRALLRGSIYYSVA